MAEVCTVAFLVISSWTDVRKREISLILTGIYACFGCVWSVMNGRRPEDFLVPAGIGIFVLAVGILSREEVGMGDGWILLALGTMLDTGTYIRVVFLGMFFASGWAAVLLAVLKKGKKTEIPLVPFLFLGYVTELII